MKKKKKKKRESSRQELAPAQGRVRSIPSDIQKKKQSLCHHATQVEMFALHVAVFTHSDSTEIRVGYDFVTSVSFYYLEDETRLLKSATKP